MVNKVNVQKLIDLLSKMPDEKFKMEDWLSRQGPSVDETRNVEPGFIGFKRITLTSEQMIDNCGTVGCIGGWASVLMRAELNKPLAWEGPYFTCTPDDELTQFDQEAVGEWLGIGYGDGHNLFYANGGPRRMEEVRKIHALRVLENLHDTGEVDWSEDMTGRVEDDEKLESA